MAGIIKGPVTAILLMTLALLWPIVAVAQQFSAEEVTALFPGSGNSVHAEAVSGSPPAANVTVGTKVIGYAFSTSAVTGSVGYSGKPLDIHVGLSTEGKITGARLASHQEPILVIGIESKDLEDFVSRLTNIDITADSVSRLKALRRNGRDHVAGATVSSRVMRHSVLRSARAVALSRGLIAGSGGASGIDRTRFDPVDWNGLIAMKALTRLTVGRGEVAELRGFTDGERDGVFVDVFTGLMTPPTIGQNLLGQRLYEQLVANIGPEDNLLLIAANGLYSVKGTEWRKGGFFDRIQIVQGRKTIRLLAANHHNVATLKAPGSPEFREAGVFAVPVSTGFNPARPWQLELLVTPIEADAAPKTLSVEYTVPNRFLSSPTDVEVAKTLKAEENVLWQNIWRERLPELVGLLIMLAALTVILFGQDWLARRRTLYRRVRIAYLAVTFLFLGLYAGTQLSVVNVVTFTHALMSGFKWELFLLDPLVFTLWSFVALALLFWGRGVFCGWLCPFGALQELVNEIARKLGVRQINVPWGLHERLWPIKYALFLAILGVSLQSIIWAYKIAEVEPFKTAIALKFIRAWPFVLYAVALLAAGIFIERFFCRYLCPLGAAIAIPAKLRLFEWLKRRQQCGRECRICNTTCTVQAINPLGQINPNECIYCLQCQANYHDASVCLPLKARAARRAGQQPPAGGSQTGGAHAG